MNDMHRSALNTNMITWWENCYCTLLFHFVSCLFSFDTLWSLLHIIKYPLQKFLPLPGCYWKVLQVLYSTNFHTYHHWSIEWEICWPLTVLRVGNKFLLFKEYFLSYWQILTFFIYLLGIGISFSKN